MLSITERSMLIFPFMFVKLSISTFRQFLSHIFWNYILGTCIFGIVINETIILSLEIIFFIFANTFYPKFYLCDINIDI